MKRLPSRAGADGAALLERAEEAMGRERIQRARAIRLRIWIGAAIPGLRRNLRNAAPGQDARFPIIQ